MLKCITLDGDVSTLNDLMEYLEKIDRTLAEVNELLANKRAEQAVYLREGSKIVRLNQEDILYLEGYGGDYVKVHRIEGKPILSQVSLKRFEECLGENFCRVHRSYIISLSHINYIGIIHFRLVCLYIIKIRKDVGSREKCPTFCYKFAE